MSRFTFCNCPAGFSADPERHAPDCPGRSGAGKPRKTEVASAQSKPPALGGEPEVTAWIISDEDGTIDATVRWDVAKHSFGDVTPMISKAAHVYSLAPLQAEIERLKAWGKANGDLAQTAMDKAFAANHERDQLKARCDGLEGLLSKATEQEIDTVVQCDKFKALLRDLVRDSLASDFNEHWDSYQDAKDALSTPAGSEQV